MVKLSTAKLKSVVELTWFQNSEKKSEEITKECTSNNSPSTCTKCAAGYYNPPNHRSGCKQCDICNAAEGSIQEEPCTVSSNAVCSCPEGSLPKNDQNTACLCVSGKEIIDRKCQPCADGYFSSRENSKCRPWTNCSALGLAVLVAGSVTQDVQCSKPKSTTAWPLPTPVTPTSPPPRERRPGKGETSTPESSVTSTKHSTPRSAMNWDTVTLILITVTLLMAMAGIILAVIIQTKKKKANRGFIRSNRCKVPVQEESTDSDSSLAKNSPV
ncbi:tumor necrosis factor receptor superfamily member 9-like [Mantella aurantiaca]